MPTINEILRTKQLASLEDQVKSKSNQKDSNGVNFSNTIRDFLQAVNEDKKEAGAAVQDIITNKSDNIAQAMSKLEESGLSFQLMLKIRNELLNAYNEIKRMPV